MSERGKNVELDEVVWQAWLEKNRALDRLRFRRRLKVAAIVMLCLIASAMLWNSKATRHNFDDFRSAGRFGIPEMSGRSLDLKEVIT